MAVLTLADLRLASRRLADMEFSQFIKDPELNTIVNEALAELIDLLVMSGETYFIDEHSFSTVPGTSEYALPVDFYKVLGVDNVSMPDTPIALRQWMFQERNAVQASIPFSVYPSSFMYRILGTNIRILPVPTSVVNIKMYYIPALTYLSNDSDSFTFTNGYEKFVIYSAAIQMLMKEESDTRPYERERDRIKARLEAAAGNRDASSPQRIVDSRGMTGYVFADGYEI